MPPGWMVACQVEYDSTTRGSIFAKLGLTQENDYHRRVRAVLLHLSP